MPPSSRLWAITSYFNPAGYRRRLENYRIFRERLAVPLLTVELAYAEAPELGSGDADMLVQLRGRDVMWQKERLLNLAVVALPASCDRVIWLDCDVVFAEDDWVAQLDRALDDFVTVQPYGHVRYLTRHWKAGEPAGEATEFVSSSVARSIARGEAPAEVFGEPVVDRRLHHAAGFAWAARRKLIEELGLYDASIIGGGDRLIGAACYGCSAEIARVHRMNGARRDHHLAWAARWSAAVDGSVGRLDTDILHQWHGDLTDRRGAERHLRLNEFDYDPFGDIASDEQGTWRWASAKPAMHTFLRDYFASRKEDG